MERRFSYVNGADPPGKRLLIRMVELAASRSRKLRRARSFVESRPDAARFWAELPGAAGIGLTLDGARSRPCRPPGRCSSRPTTRSAFWTA